MTPWTVACQAPLSMGFSRQEYWKGLPFPSPGDLPDPVIEPRFPALQRDSLPSELPGKPKNIGVGIPGCYKKKNYGSVVIKNRDMQAVEKNLHPMSHFSESFERCVPSNFVI